MEKTKITKNTTLRELMEIKGVEEILEKHQLPCLHCPLASQEIEKLKLGQVAEMYGLDAEKIIKEIKEKR